MLQGGGGDGGSHLECVLPRHCHCLTDSVRPWASDHLDSYSEVKSEDKKEIVLMFTTSKQDFEPDCEG